MTAILLPVSIVIFMAAVAMLVFGLVGKKEETNKVLTAVEHYGLGKSTEAKKVKAPTQSSITQQILGSADKVMASRESTSKTMALIERADLPWRAGEWLVLRIVAAIVLVVAAWLFFADESPVLALIIGALAGFFLPSFILRFLAKRRAGKFESVLPDVLMLVATSLTSGFSLPQALDAVARDAPEPAAKEFSRALAETRIGTDVDVALEKMAARMQSENMKWTTMAIRIQREVGGNLAETLRTTTKTLREREELKGLVKTLSAEGKLSAYVLVALPVGVFLYMTQVNYDYVSLLWTTFYGWVMTGLGLLSLGLGILWMRKTVTIEV